MKLFSNISRRSLLFAFLLIVILLPSCNHLQTREAFNNLYQETRYDYANFYSASNILPSAIGLGVGAAMANTDADQEVFDWYQDKIRNHNTDTFGKFCQNFGDGTIMIPFTGAAYLLGSMGGISTQNTVGRWGDRSLRAYLVGAPELLAWQVFTGGSRPDEYRGSRWRPFQDSHGVSGHAFIGAVPFMTAAKMTNSFAAKSALYLGSTLCAWSRVNKGRHYPSQAFLGWWLAYEAVSSVDTTEKNRRVHFAPVAGTDFMGVGATIKF